MKERKWFIGAINDRGDRRTGRDSRLRSYTVGQRKGSEQFTTALMRGRITWGTPIVRSGDV